MNSKDKKVLALMISDEIMNLPGYLARVNIRRNYSASTPFEDINIWFAKSDGTEHEKTIHLSSKTIYETKWQDIAKSIVSHLEM